jgi:hypothetical protein
MCAERRWHGHGGDTKLMACTRQGKEDRGNGEERTGGVGWVSYAGEQPRVCMSARAQVRPGRTGPRPGGGVCGKNVGGAAVAMAQHRQHVHDKGLCSHDSRPKKGRAFARRWRAQRVGVGGKPELGDTRRNKGTTPLQGKEERAAMMAAAAASDRLGSMAGSQATAGLRGGAVRDSGQHTNSELTWLGPAPARRPGPQ